MLSNFSCVSQNADKLTLRFYHRYIDPLQINLTKCIQLRNKLFWSKAIQFQFGMTWNWFLYTWIFMGKSYEINARILTIFVTWSQVFVISECSAWKTGTVHSQGKYFCWPQACVQEHIYLCPTIQLLLYTKAMRFRGSSSSCSICYSSICLWDEVQCKAIEQESV